MWVVSEVVGTVEVLQRQQRSLTGGGAAEELQAALLDVLDEQVPLIFRRLSVLGSDNAGGPVQVQHVDQLLLLPLQLLDLGFQVRVDRLQLLRLLWRKEDGGEG